MHDARNLSVLVTLDRFFKENPMPYCLRPGFRGLAVLLLLSAVSPLRFQSSAQQSRGSLQLIPGTTLRVALPAQLATRGGGADRISSTETRR
jgi:hypothetical protein